MVYTEDFSMHAIVLGFQKLGHIYYSNISKTHMHGYFNLALRCTMLE